MSNLVYRVVGLDKDDATHLYNYAKRHGFEPIKKKIDPVAGHAYLAYYNVESYYSDFSRCVWHWKKLRKLEDRNSIKALEVVVK